MKRSKILFLFAAIIIFIIFQITAFAMSIEPLSFESVLKPGETYPFEIHVVSPGKPEEVKLVLFEAKQQLDGSLQFIEPNPDSDSPTKWVEIPAKVSITNDLPVTVKGIIKVPLKAAGGTYHMAVIAESLVTNTQQLRLNLNIKIRYAIRLIVRVERLGLKPSAQVEQFDMVKGESGEPVIQLMAENNSPVDFITSATVTIRNTQKKLIDRVELKPRSSWDANFIDTRIFPDTELLYYGMPKEVLLPGQYEMRTFYRFASSGQIMKTKIITVRAGEYNYPKEKLKTIKVTPTEVSFEGKPGTIAIKAVKIENRSDKPMMIITEIADISSNYPYSINDNTEIRIQGDKKFTLEPGRMHVSVLIVKFPKDMPLQANYGALQVKSYSMDDKPVLLENSSVLLAASIPGTLTHSAEVTNLIGEADKSRYLLLAIVKNTGKVKITPDITAVIKDKRNNIIDSIKFSVEGDDTASIYPAKNMTYTGTTAKKLQPGEYHAIISIAENDKSIGLSQMNLIVK
jgi:hypothetical protein